ncbi:hypothetical protein KEM60_02883 [Austwickia sp. TVS 96-490-7B]|uniref:hypothetical protein n=1 Tax=Austwickia sp. TVS 96-490-7B TaxID=2830843 RepID=UPI001C55B48E|nr:hypothetical protein [Austwickia sp. TVS 96-490-7B]MBW3086654.1 hypothetical protein [Austwickia sp. TVS 96-490-7B]
MTMMVGQVSVSHVVFTGVVGAIIALISAAVSLSHRQDYVRRDVDRLVADGVALPLDDAEIVWQRQRARAQGRIFGQSVGAAVFFIMVTSVTDGPMRGANLLVTALGSVSIVLCVGASETWAHVRAIPAMQLRRVAMSRSRDLAGYTPPWNRTVARDVAAMPAIQILVGVTLALLGQQRVLMLVVVPAVAALGLWWILHALVAHVLECPMPADSPGSLLWTELQRALLLHELTVLTAAVTVIVTIFPLVLAVLIAPAELPSYLPWLAGAEGVIATLFLIVGILREHQGRTLRWFRQHAGQELTT